MTLSDPPEAGGVSWSRVEEGFYVGSRRGDFMGYIDRLPNEGYVAFDAFSRPLGTFPDQAAAMTAVTSPPIFGDQPSEHGR